MPTRYAACAAALCLLSCLVAPAPVRAADGSPVIQVEDAPAADDPASQGTAGECVLEPGPSIPLSYVRQPPGYFTSFAWRIPVSACTACPAPHAPLLRSLTFRVRWFTACEAQAEVTIVGATGPPGCPVPEPANVLCGPVTYGISGTGDVSTPYTLPLPAGCCVTGEAFAWVRLIGTGDCPPGPVPGGDFLPGLGAAEPFCSACEQYVSWFPESPSLTDWCAAPGQRLLWMRVDADCCGATDIGQRSWGTLKTRYR